MKRSKKASAPKKRRKQTTKGRITSALRRCWMRDPERTQCLKEAQISKGVYACEMCGKPCLRKECQIDHIEPVGKFVSWDRFIERLFCSRNLLRVLCKPCHHEVTYG